MLGAGATSAPAAGVWLPSPTKSISGNSNPRTYFPGASPPNPSAILHKTHAFPLLSTFPRHFSTKAAAAASSSSSSSSSSSVGSPEYKEEPATKVKFQKLLSLPGCSTPLSLTGTGYKEKVFAIIGVKVYAAGLYVNPSLLSTLDAWKGRSAQYIQEDSSLFDSFFQAPLEKSLHIVLVRDVDGKTFWDALDDAISPRIKSPTPVDESALSTFRSIFQGRSLKKGTFIFLTWPDPTKILVCVSSDGFPSAIDATIESKKVALALLDVFFGGDPVSPSLKASVAKGLATMLNK